LALTVPAKARPVEILKSEEKWSVYTLANGTKVRMKPVVADVLFVPGEFNPDGEPLYITRAGLMISTKSPAKLRKSRAAKR
jgi:hypothetical protein